MSKEKLEEAFYELVNPYVKNYPDKDILHWNDGRPMVPLPFFITLPKSISDQVLDLLNTVP